MSTCATPGCERKLRSDNRRGYCVEHSTAAGREGVNTCAASGCEKALRSDNRRGYCVEHRTMAPEFREAATRNTAKWYAKTRATLKRECGAPGCARLLYSDNRSGFCTSHRGLNPARRASQAARGADRYAANPAQVRAQRAAWRAANRERVAAQHVARYAANPEEFARRSRKRRANEVCLWVENYTFDEVLARTGPTCHLCAVDISGLARKAVAIEHIIPLFLGGPDCLPNVATACASCNAAKHAKPGSMFDSLFATAVEAYEFHHGHRYDEANLVWPCAEPCKLVERAHADPKLRKYAIRLGIIEGGADDV